MASIFLKFLKSTNSLIFLLISILGFSLSCKRDEPLIMYGSPHADYIINGNIVSAADNKPIKDIIVEMPFTRTADLSDDMGDFRLRANGVFNLKYELKFTDTDGALNGEFETLDTTIVFQDPKFTGGDGHWYMGETEKEVYIKLKPKK